MARRFDVGEYLYMSAPVTAAPFTISCIAELDFTANNKAMVCLADTAVNDHSFLLYTTSAGTAAFFINAGGNAQTSPILYNSNVFNYFTAVEVASNDHRCFVNGTKATSSGNITPLSIDTLGIATRVDATPDMGLGGEMAEVAIWDVALSDSEAVSLSKGFSPLLVQPQNLVFYLPLIKDDDNDLISGTSLSVNGTPELYNHPRIYYPRK